jgi:hypothetical protein
MNESFSILKKKQPPKLIPNVRHFVFRVSVFFIPNIRHFLLRSSVNFCSEHLDDFRFGHPTNKFILYKPIPTIWSLDRMSGRTRMKRDKANNILHKKINIYTRIGKCTQEIVRNFRIFIEIMKF